MNRRRNYRRKDWWVTNRKRMRCFCWRRRRGRPSSQYWSKSLSRSQKSSKRPCRSRKEINRKNPLVLRIKTKVKIIIALTVRDHLRCLLMMKMTMIGCARSMNSTVSLTTHWPYFPRKPHHLRNQKRWPTLVRQSCFKAKNSRLRIYRMSTYLTFLRK